jgi:hypothetical protein
VNLATRFAVTVGNNWLAAWCDRSWKETGIHWTSLAYGFATVSCSPVPLDIDRINDKGRIAMERATEVYRRHSLVAAKAGSGWLGVIWGNRKKIHECEGSSKEVVLDMLRTFVDESFVTIARQRPAPPNGDDYVHAFQTILDELPDSYCAMLKAHYHAPNQKNYHDCSR